MGSRLLTSTGVFCIFGMRPSLVEREIICLAFVFNEEFGVDAVAVVDEGEGDGLIEVKERAIDDIVPGGVFDGVVVDDDVTAMDTGLGDRSVGWDVVGAGGAVEELFDLVVNHGDAGHQAKGEEEVGDGAREGDEHALPAGVSVEVAGIGGGDAAGCEFVACEAHLAGHFDVAAEGDGCELIFGIAAAEAEEAFAEADGEDLNADAAELGDGEVAELVDQNHDAKDDEKLNNCRHEVGEDLVTGFLLLSYAGGLAGNHFARIFPRGKICLEHFGDRCRGLTGGSL